jgi:hypothetical protein
MLGREQLILFDGYLRTPRTSWVVSKSTGKPTGQDDSAIHPDLFKYPRIITSSGELKSWLATHRKDSSVARGIEFDSQSLKSTDLARLYQVGRQRETWYRVTVPLALHHSCFSEASGRAILRRSGPKEKKTMQLT